MLLKSSELELSADWCVEERMKSLLPQLLFALLLSALMGMQARPVIAAKKPAASDSKPPAVYVKIVLPKKARPDGKKPVVEPWLVKKLQKLSKGEFRAITGWVRLAEGRFESTNVMDSGVEGEWKGCPVGGEVVRSSKGVLTVSLTGWSPVGDHVEVTFSKPTSGSMQIGTVEWRKDEIAAFAVIHVGPPPK